MKFHLITFLIIFALLLIGCVQPISNTPLPATAALTDLQTPFPEQTRVPSSPTPSLLLQPSTTTMHISPTPTSVSTLNPDERNAYLLDWVQNTENCQLPCWLGISPGESTWSELVPMFYNLGAIMITDPKSTFVFHGIGGFTQHDISTVFELYEQNDRIVSIDVHVDGWDDNSLSIYREMWDSYAPEMIIEDYGCPSQVWILSESNPSGDYPPPNQNEYRIWFTYENLNWEIGYNGLVDYEPIYQICPTYREPGNLGQRLRIEIWFNESRSIIENNAMNYTARLTIEEAAGLSTEEFCSLYTRDVEPVCFTTPRNLWP